ncbi:LysR family transcriptional regulator [Sphingomonas albertensis]|uniref:LysR family transcriptional regulator n=1 Tax=Sphingomonas albertensis TaxID=2762591 RepID=A0ABR7AKW7_9SPHN|nr:LysR family transcriptional regulator [Sphingomonas albertensis]MBC3941111.1 LysR family transcriptional regulator [Sphingomonas albertensis]
MSFDIIALRYAVLTADTLSFARAAAQEGVKQATLSKRIASLESRLGLNLFERSTRGAVPTETGAGFLDVARRILFDLEALQANGRAIGAGHGGKLGIGFSTSLAAGNMRALIVDFVHDFPQLRLLNIEGDRCRLAQALHARSIDFAVISGDVPEIGLKRRAMWSERIMVMLHDEHMLAQKDRVYWSDLRAERFILPRQGSGTDLADLVRARLGEPGWQPDVETQEVSRENVANFVPIGRYVTLTTDTVLGRVLPGVVLREIHELSAHISHISYAGYWRSDNSSPALARLLKLVGDRYPP